MPNEELIKFMENIRFCFSKCISKAILEAMSSGFSVFAFENKNILKYHMKIQNGFYFTKF